MLSGRANVSSKIPEAGQLMRVRTRTYLVEAVDHLGGVGTQARLACLDGDAQGRQLEFIWEIELDAQILDGGDSRDKRHDLVY